MGEIFYMIEVENTLAKDDWWVVGIFDASDQAVTVFTQRKGKKDSVRMVKCEVIMESRR